MQDFRRVRELEVISSKKVSNNMLRLSFYSKDLFDFSDKEKGGYVKLLFNQMKNKSDKELLRPYTIRNFRKKELEIDIDFVTHKESKGIASTWASRAVTGDKIRISGPGAKQQLKNDRDWYFFIGDMSALPAISVNLETISKDSKGIIIIQVLSKFDIIKLEKPKNILLYWIVNPDERKSKNYLYKKVTSIKWLQGCPYVWGAGEFSDIKLLREYFLVKGLRKENMYLSSYWKIDSDQEEHKIIKKIDNIEWSKS